MSDQDIIALLLVTGFWTWTASILTHELLFHRKEKP